MEPMGRLWWVGVDCRLPDGIRVVLEMRVAVWVPNIVRHPYKKDPKRDPNVENYPCAEFTSPLACAFFCQGTCFSAGRETVYLKKVCGRPKYGS